MILTTQFNLIYKLDCIPRVEQRHIRQNIVIAKSLRQLDGGECFLIDLPLNFWNANNNLDSLSLLNPLAHPE